jgi:tRNA A-37 threonylcarbamoyl transferase component Bud32
MITDSQEKVPAPGDILDGKYRVLRVLGRGGMGVVVEAVRLGLGEHVAVKILHARYLESEDALARFHHEARALATIRGEHSVRVLDIGTTDEGSPYIVMELLLGSDLAAIAKTAHLSADEAVLYVLQACEGMAEVHANGIVHRDLKPGNLFLTRRIDGRPLVKVLDFGIAKSALPMDDSARAVTMTLVALGTPLYMSPEQIRCSKDVDARTDVWSLGAILYELLTGRPPFFGNSAANITAQVLEATPPSLTTVGLPESLDGVVQRALAKRPAQRFTDVASFAKALAPFAGPQGLEHAERAERILRREGRGAGATPFRETGTNDGPTTLFQTAVASSASLPPPQRAWLGPAAIALLSALFVVIAWALADTVQAKPPPTPDVRRAIASLFAARAAAVRAVFAMEARGTARDIDSLPEAPSPSAAEAPPRNVPVAEKPSAAKPTPPTPQAQPVTRPVPRAPQSAADPDDLLSTRK